MRSTPNPVVRPGYPRCQSKRLDDTDEMHRIKGLRDMDLEARSQKPSAMVTRQRGHGSGRGCASASRRERTDALDQPVTDLDRQRHVAQEHVGPFSLPDVEGGAR
jgi:hypothetical protein